MTFVMMAMLFMLSAQMLHQEDIPLLSYSDIRIMLAQYRTRRDITFDEVLRQMEHRHRQDNHQLIWPIKNNAFNSLRF